MEKEDQTKGFDRIEGEVKDLLANYFGETDSTKLEELILKYIQAPNGLEIADFRTLQQSIQRIGGPRVREMNSRYYSEGKSVISFGISLPKSNDLAIQNSKYSGHFEIDLYANMPVSYDDLDSMMFSNSNNVEYKYFEQSNILGYAIPQAFYDTHKEEIIKLEQEASQHNYDETVVKEFAEDLFKKYSEEEVKTDLRDTTKDERMQHARDIISNLTNGKNIEDITLKELDEIKNSLEKRKQQLAILVAEKFATKENEPEKE